MCIRDSHSFRTGLQRVKQPGAAERLGMEAGDAAARLVVTPSVSYTHLRAHETPEHLVCRLLLEKKKTKPLLYFSFFFNDTATTEIYTRSLVGSVRCV